MSIFNKIQLKKPKHSIFDLSYDHKTSFKMGYLVPIHLQECIPGDSFKMNTEAMFRLMPMISPIMHKVDIYTHSFFVPNRILWDGWEKWITGGQNPNGTMPAFPTISTTSDTFTDVKASTLGDYMGLPVDTQLEGDTHINALPFAAYQKIWYEYYRDQNLIDVPEITLTDGVQTDANSDILGTLRKRAWEHDYFTSCLPFAQKGDVVELPMEFTPSTIDVKINPIANQAPTIVDQNGTPITNVNMETGNVGQMDLGGITGRIDPDGDLIIDTEDLHTTTTINDLRTAFSLQKWLEKNARAGTRYVESILNHFGVRSSDKRMQRPEYLGGSKASMSISEVLQTSETATSPQGNMAGHGISVSEGKAFNYFCEEHGFIITILSVRPRTAYYQGLDRLWNKTIDRMQYYWPDFAFLGEQEVLNKELYYNQADSLNEETFGYIPRYSEYRYNASRVSGEMRKTLDFWHMAREFANRPLLNQSFVECTPTKRIFAVEDAEQDEIVAHIYHRIIAKRPIPKYGNPGGI